MTSSRPEVDRSSRHAPLVRFRRVDAGMTQLYDLRAQDDLVAQMQETSLTRMDIGLVPDPLDSETIEVIAGGLPPRALRLVTEWAREHQSRAA